MNKIRRGKYTKYASIKQLRELLMNEEDSIPIEEVIENAKKKWQR